MIFFFKSLLFVIDYREVLLVKSREIIYKLMRGRFKKHMHFISQSYTRQMGLRSPPLG